MADYCDTPQILTLTLGTTTLDLMSDQQGFRVAEVDLSYPDVRDDADLAADRHGMVDLTRYFGARAVTISGSVVGSPAGSRQKVIHLLAPFLNPANRPVLTYQIDADAGPRTMTLRPSELSIPFNNPTVSQFQVGWKAPDPLAYDANVKTGYAYPGAWGGRIYNLVFNRVYPAGGGSSGLTYNYGDFNAYPTIRIYGPASTVQLSFAPSGVASFFLTFNASFVIGAGHYVELNCRTRTVYLDGDPTQSVYNQLQWSQQGVWPWIPPGGYCNWVLSATNISAVTQAQIVWADPYLI